MYDTSISIKHGMKTKEFYEKPVFAGLEFGCRVDEILAKINRRLV
jgi:hypothetical protein